MNTYAVRLHQDGDWYIARKVKASEYGSALGLIAENPDWEVWSEDRTTAFLGYVGNGETAINLDNTQEAD